MHSRPTKRLVTIAGLVVVAALAGSATRGSGDIVLAGAGQGPAVTVTVTPTLPTDTATAAPPTGAPAATDTAASRAAASGNIAAAKAGAASKAAAAAKARAAAMKASAAAAKWVVTKVVDGDTIWAVRAGVKRKVRLIGIDTPEVGQCGYTEATRNLRGIIGGQPVTLTAGARDDVDRYGRLLRYVDVNGVDAGLRQVEQGYAVARYDSRDGYGRHLRETSYVQSDRSSPRAACAAPVTAGTAGSSGSTGGSGASGFTGSWPLAGDTYPCPRARPVKGNEGSMIAHEPGDRYYNITKPEQCFASMSGAEAAGFRPAKV